MKKKYELPEIKGDFGFVLNKIFTIYKEIFIGSKYVSNSCDVGILMELEGQIYKLKISGEIEELIAHLVQGKIEENIVEIIQVSH